ESALSEHFHGRTEDHRLITGQGQYTADFNFPNQLHAAFVRSDRAHADILSIDASPARAIKGVVAVFTAADLVEEKLGPLPILGKYEGRNGKTIIRTHRPILADKKVRYVGEQIVMVVAESAAIARDAADLITIDYRDLPVVAEAADAMALSAAQLHDNIPGNVCYEGETGNAAAVEDAFKKAHHVTRVAAESNRVIGSPMEPRACVVSFDPASGNYRLAMPKQGLLNMRSQLAGIFNIPAEKFIIEAHDVGGSFGVRSAAYPEYIAMMVATKRLGRPIKWVATRSECFLTDSHGRAMSIIGELALDKNGVFLASRFQFIANLGAYQSLTGSFLATNNTAVCAVGVYKTPAHYGRVTLVLTNTTPVAAYRGAGRPDVAFINERVVDQAAFEMGIDPAEIRRRNFIPKEAFPYKTPNAATYDSGDYLTGLAMALKQIDWPEFPKRRVMSKQQGRLRGIGLSCFIEGTGAGAYPKDQAEVRFERDGSVTVFTVTQTQGQGHETAFPMIVGEVLGIPIEKIRLKASLPDTKLIGNHTGGSRSTVGAGSACLLAARRALDLAKRYASEELGAEMIEIQFDHGVFAAKGKSISMESLIARLGEELPEGEYHPLDAWGEGVFGATFPNGQHIAEVEIDPETGVIDLVSYSAVDDCGKVIDHTLLEGQLVGGMAQGIGQAMGEHGVYDRETGQLLAGSYMDYWMPRAGWLGDLHVGDNGVPSPNNPLGVKGAGESGTTGSIAAFVNASLDALRTVGVTQIEMPLTPAKVWNAIRTARAN
ncbi:MAG: xanthine dehydrogenase family protein molybdopterin-binding subunit, partial [Betaproteobacteria bacterium]|nr:xanthine dehydrogenase family protein molybdopterin-binding subunit [Betaproteobacteria bacterium]